MILADRTASKAPHPVSYCQRIGVSRHFAYDGADMRDHYLVTLDVAAQMWFNTILTVSRRLLHQLHSFHVVLKAFAAIYFIIIIISVTVHFTYRYIERRCCLHANCVVCMSLSLPTIYIYMHTSNAYAHTIHTGCAHDIHVCVSVRMVTFLSKSFHPRRRDGALRATQGRGERARQRQAKGRGKAWNQTKKKKDEWRVERYKKKEKN